MVDFESWDDKGVPSPEGVDRHEGDTLVIPPNKGARDLTLDDFAEDGGHYIGGQNKLRMTNTSTTVKTMVPVTIKRTPDEVSSGGFFRGAPDQLSPFQ